MSGSANTRSKNSRGSTAARTEPRGERRQPGSRNATLEFMRILGSLLGISIGLTLISICIGAFYLSNEAVTIMREIASRDVSGPRKQVDAYENFFTGLDHDQYIVRKDEPRNLQNVITYLWTVEHKVSHEVTQFRWEWDMSTLKVLPRSNGALLLDRRMQNITDSEMRDFDFFNENDAFANAIVQQDVTLIGPQSLNEGWGSEQYSDSVLPALISPEQALSRKSGYDSQQKKQLEEEQVSGEEAPEEEAGEAEEVIVPEINVPPAHPANPPVKEDG
jgi:hypothetical protein